MRLCRHFTALSAIALMLLAGCGSGGGDAGSNGADDPFKIGLILPATGPLAPNGQGNRQGFEFYWEQQGHKSGERPVEIIFVDSEGKPDTAVAKVQELIEREQVDVIAGFVSSAAAMAARDIAVRTKTPLVVIQAATSKLTEQPTPLVSRVIATFETTMSILTEHAITKDGVKRIVFIGSDYEAGKDAEKAVRSVAEQHGATVVRSLFAPLGTQDFGPFLGNVPTDADAALAFFGGTDAVRFVQQYHQFGLSQKLPLYGHWALTVDPLLVQEGAAAEGIVTVQEYAHTVSNAANDTFKQAWSAKFGAQPNAWNEQGYVAAQVIDAALKAQPNATGEELGKAIQAVKLDAPRGSVSFDDHGQLTQPIYIAKVTRSADGFVNEPIEK